MAIGWDRVIGLSPYIDLYEHIDANWKERNVVIDDGTCGTEFGTAER